MIWIYFVLVGLICDIIGAVVIGRTILMKPEFSSSYHSVGLETAGLPDFATDKFKKDVEVVFRKQKTDTSIGIIILTVGFSLQGIGNIAQFYNWNL